MLILITDQKTKLMTNQNLHLPTMLMKVPRKSMVDLLKSILKSTLMSTLTRSTMKKIMKMKITERTMKMITMAVKMMVIMITLKLSLMTMTMSTKIRKMPMRFRRLMNTLIREKVNWFHVKSVLKKSYLFAFFRRICRHSNSTSWRNGHRVMSGRGSGHLHVRMSGRSQRFWFVQRWVQWKMSQ